MQTEKESFLTSGSSRCVQLSQICHQPFRTKHYNRPDISAGFLTRLRYALLCPPHGKLGRFCTFVFCMLSVWLMALSVSPRDAFPGTNIFSLIVLFTAGVLVGKLVSLVKLPNILGMFFAGVIFRNTPHLDIAQHILSFWSSSLKNFALTILLLQAGMSLAPIPFSFDSILYRIHLMPFIAEFAACSLVYKFLLGLPSSWSLSLGSLLSGVSTAVITSQLLKLQDLDYGTNQKIPSQLIVTSVINNAFAIIINNLVWTKASSMKIFIQRTLDPFLEILMGLLFGTVLWYFPPQETRFSFFLRAVLTLLGSFLPLIGFSATGLPANGQLCVLTIGYVATLKWKKENNQGGQTIKQEMLKLVGNLWLTLQPLYFGLLGCELNLSSLDIKVIGLICIALFVGQLCRIISSLLMTLASSLNIKERLFISVALMPKADIQVVLNALILQKAIEKEEDKTLLQYGYIVSNMTLFVSFFTLPLGAAFIAWIAPSLLHQRIMLRRNSSATRHVTNRSRFLLEGKELLKEGINAEEHLLEEEADTKF